MRKILQARFSDKRWRVGTLGGWNITLQGVGPDGRYNGELKTVNPWWFWLWYVPVATVTTEHFTRRVP